jgi:hypothetical protein
MADEARILTALTTEHFGLAGARSQAAAESASRSALYLGSVSATLVGLGLTAQASNGFPAGTRDQPHPPLLPRASR